MKLLVTGANGFIGSNLSLELEKQGHEVITPQENAVKIYARREVTNSGGKHHLSADRHIADFFSEHVGNGNRALRLKMHGARVFKLDSEVYRTFLDKKRPGKIKNISLFQAASRNRYQNQHSHLCPDFKLLTLFYFRRLKKSHAKMPARLGIGRSFDGVRNIFCGPLREHK